MLFQLLSTSNYVSFNVSLANLLGLHPAIYLSEVINIYDKAYRKNKLIDDSFIIERKYIKDRTTIDEKEQKDIEDKLCEIGVISKPNEKNKRQIKVDISFLTTLLMTKDEKLIKSVKKIAERKVEKKTKEENYKDFTKTTITTDNEELRKAYEDWVDAVFMKVGYINPQAVEMAQKLIDERSKRNLDVALQILKIATVNGYRDVSWAIKIYNENPIYQVKEQKKPRVTQAVLFSDEVF